jgi:hypothetical protein
MLNVKETVYHYVGELSEYVCYLKSFPHHSIIYILTHVAALCSKFCHLKDKDVIKIHYFNPGGGGG